MIKEQKFIDLFNQLDEYLRIKHFNNNSSYTSYVKKLFYVKKHKLEPLIQRNSNFDILKKAGDIRNIVVHNQNIIVPSDSFLKQFEILVKRITQPKMVSEIMTQYRDLLTKDMDDRLSDVIDLMKEKGFASIPILDGKDFVGMFTEKTMFDYLTISNRIVDKNMNLRSLLPVIDLDKEPRAYFKFINKSMAVDEAYQIFMDDFKLKHQLILLLVTENGKKDEQLLGIVALRDLKNELNDLF